MTAILAAVLLWSQPTGADAIHGQATYYADGLMHEVMGNRGLAYPDGVALNRAGDLGRWVWLQWNDGDVTGPLPVVDCAQEEHYAAREQQGRVVEVSARVARERGFYGVGPVPVTVWFEEPVRSWE